MFNLDCVGAHLDSNRLARPFPFGRFGCVSFFQVSEWFPAASSGSGIGKPGENQTLISVSTEAVAETLTKSDRLQVAYEPAPVFEPVPAIAPVPPEHPANVPLKIISRHWHDPSDQKAAQSATGRTKSKIPKKNSRVVERNPTLEADACGPNQLDRVKRLFNLATDCRRSN